MKKKRSYVSMVESKIQEGLKKGLFDDLPGKGKPLDFEKNYFKSENWAANKILENANYQPEWLKLSNEIRQNKEELMKMIEKLLWWLKQQKERLHTTKDKTQLEILDTVKKNYEHNKIKYMEILSSINPKIRRMNMLVPISRFQKMVIDEEEWKEKFYVCTELYQELLKISIEIETEKKQTIIDKFLNFFFRK